VKAILPCRGTGAEEFAAAVKPKDGDEFTGIVRCTLNLMESLEFEKLSLVPFLVSVGFSLLAHANILIESRVVSETDPSVVAVLPLWLFGNDDREAVYKQTRDKVLVLDQSDDSTRLIGLLFLAAKVRWVMLQVLGKWDLSDAQSIAAAITREGRMLADAIRSDVDTINEQLQFPPDVLREIVRQL
jgi:hypothetical protein